MPTTSVDSQRNITRTKRGTVVRVVDAKTVVVEVATEKQHPKYQKRYVTTKRYLSHVVDKPVEEGTEVTITESRPHSARKRWRILP